MEPILTDLDPGTTPSDPLTDSPPRFLAGLLGDFPQNDGLHHLPAMLRAPRCLVRLKARHTVYTGTN